jgi:REP element-mobilizing transposase RayT
MAGGVWNLRSQRCFTRLCRAMWAGGRREHFRLVHFAVMGNHLHVLVEASDREGLTRGMQGLGIRIARALNHLMQRRGRVVDDRYHAHILRTPTEVRHARRYLLNNAARHYGSVGTDAFASQRPLVPPRTWLLRQTC